MASEQIPENLNQGWSIVSGSFDPETTALTAVEFDGLDADWVHNLPEIVRARTLAVEAIVEALEECTPELFDDEQSTDQVVKSIQGASLMIEAYSYTEMAGGLKEKAGDLELNGVPVMQAVSFLLEQSTIDQPVTIAGREKSYKPVSKGDVRRMSEAIVRYLHIQQQPTEAGDDDSVRGL